MVSIADSKPSVKTAFSERAAHAAACAVCVVMLLCIVMRAAGMTMTFDEAYTYCDFVRHFTFTPRHLVELYRTSNSNNHMLNTVLSAAVEQITGVTYNEFLIRLPNVIAGAVMLGFLLWMYVRRILTAPAFYCLATSYFVNEFLSFARGYGLAVCLITLTFGLYLMWKKNDFQGVKYPALILISYTLACTANTICLLIAPAFGLVCIGMLAVKKTLLRFLKTCWPLILICFAVIAAMLLFHLRVTMRVPQVQYDVKADSLFEAWFVTMGLFTTANHTAAVVLGLVQIALCLFNLVMYFSRCPLISEKRRPDASKDSAENPVSTADAGSKPESLNGRPGFPAFTVCYLFSMAVIGVLGIADDGAFHTGRVLLPLFPLVPFLLQEAAEYAAQLSAGTFLRGQAKMITALAVCAAFTVTSLVTLRPADGHEFTNEPEVRTAAYRHVFEDGPEYEGFFFTVYWFYEQQAEMIREQ